MTEDDLREFRIQNIKRQLDGPILPSEREALWQRLREEIDLRPPRQPDASTQAD